MPLQLIEIELVSRTLVRLAMPDHPGGTYRFAGIWRRDRPPGPAASWLLDQFVELGRNDVEEQGLSNIRSEEHTSELQSLMRISYAVFCLKNKKRNNKLQVQLQI